MAKEPNAEPLEGVEIEEPKSKKGLIIGVVAVLVLGGGGAGAFFAMKGGGAAAGGPGGEQAEALGKRVALDHFIVNLNEARSTRYLKVEFALELSDESVEELVKERQDVIRDRVLTYLSGLTIDDVRGSETKEVIREVLIRRTNEALGSEDAVKNVLFKDFVVQ